MNKNLMHIAIIVLIVLGVVLIKSRRKPEVKEFIPDPNISNEYFPNALDYYIGDLKVQLFEAPTYPKKSNLRQEPHKTTACLPSWSPSHGDDTIFISGQLAKTLANLTATYVYILENICYQSNQVVQLKDEWGQTFAKATVKSIIHSPRVSGSRTAIIHNLMALHGKGILDQVTTKPDLATAQVQLLPETINHEFYKPMTQFPPKHGVIKNISIENIMKQSARSRASYLFLKTTKNERLRNPFFKIAKNIKFKRINGLLTISNINKLGLSKKRPIVIFGDQINDVKPLLALKYLIPFGFQNLYWLRDPNAKKQ